jgi:hypothetical protein
MVLFRTAFQVLQAASYCLSVPSPVCGRSGSHHPCTPPPQIAHAVAPSCKPAPLIHRHSRPSHVSSTAGTSSPTNRDSSTRSGAPLSCWSCHTAPRTTFAKQHRAPLLLPHAICRMRSRSIPASSRHRLHPHHIYPP